MRNLSEEGYQKEELGENEGLGEQKNKEEEERKEERKEEELFRLKEDLVKYFTRAEPLNDFIKRLNVNEEISYKGKELKEDRELAKKEEEEQQKERELFRWSTAAPRLFTFPQLRNSTAAGTADQRVLYRQEIAVLDIETVYSSCIYFWTTVLLCLAAEIILCSTTATRLMSTSLQWGKSTDAGKAKRIKEKNRQKRRLTSPVSTHSKGQKTPDPAGAAEDKDQKRLEGSTVAPSVSVNDVSQQTSDPESAEQWEEKKLILTSATSTPSTKLGTSDGDSDEDKEQEPYKGSTAAPSASVNDASQQTSDPETGEQWEKTLILTSVTSTELGTSDGDSDEDKEQEPYKGILTSATSTPSTELGTSDGAFDEDKEQEPWKRSTAAPSASVNDASEQTLDPDSAKYREDEKLRLTSQVSTQSTEQETSDPAGSAKDEEQNRLEGPTATPSVAVNDTSQQTSVPDSAEYREDEKLTLTTATSTPSTELKTTDAGSGEDQEQELWKGTMTAVLDSVTSQGQETSGADPIEHRTHSEKWPTATSSINDSGQETLDPGHVEHRKLTEKCEPGKGFCLPLKGKDQEKRPTTPSLVTDAIPRTYKPDPVKNNQQNKWAFDSFYTKHSSGTAWKNILFRLLIFCLMTCSSASSRGKRTRCAVRPDEYLNQWRLICYFQKNLQESGEDFQVFHIKQEGPPALVVEAAWIEGEPKMFTAKGFHPDGVVNDTAAISIQSQAVHHGEIFACLLPPVLLEDAWTCHVPKLQVITDARNQEHHSTTVVTTQSTVSVPSGGGNHAPHRETFLLAVAAIVYKRLCG